MALLLTQSRHDVVRAWPAPQEFNEAIQNHEFCIENQELKSARVKLDSFGLPQPITGNFASIYQLDGDGRRYAVKCFLRHVPDQCARYEHIAAALSHGTNLAAQHTMSLAEFDFIHKGINVGNRWFPILKMEWIDGEPLDVFVKSKKDDPTTLHALAETLSTVCKALHNAGIAHGDLQHGNLLVTRENQIRLVDYDGMFVPGMETFQSIELGHCNYQHPGRTSAHFGKYLDYFSGTLIYTSLKMLALDPSLFARNVCEDSLLFRMHDLTQINSSALFADLDNHHCEEIRKLSRYLRWQLGVKLEDTIPFWEFPEKAPPLKPIEVRRSEAASSQNEKASALWQEWSGIFSFGNGAELAPPDQPAAKAPMTYRDFQVRKRDLARKERELGLRAMLALGAFFAVPYGLGYLAEFEYDFARVEGPPHQPFTGSYAFGVCEQAETAIGLLTLLLVIVPLIKLFYESNRLSDGLSHSAKVPITYKHSLKRERALGLRLALCVSAFIAAPYCLAILAHFDTYFSREMTTIEKLNYLSTPSALPSAPLPYNPFDDQYMLMSVYPETILVALIIGLLTWYKVGIPLRKLHDEKDRLSGELP